MKICADTNATMIALESTRVDVGGVVRTYCWGNTASLSETFFEFQGQHFGAPGQPLRIYL